jgi:hypothetical protein
MYIVIFPDDDGEGVYSETFATIKQVAEYINIYCSHKTTNNFEVFKAIELSPSEDTALEAALSVLKSQEAERNRKAVERREIKELISQKQATIRAKRKTLEEVGHELAQEYKTSRWNQIQGLEQEVISLNQELEQLKNA